MTYNILYIDDETQERSQTYADGLSHQGLIKIRIETPTKYEELLDELIHGQDSFDAILLDLKLDGNQDGDRKASYTAPSLATGIRSKFYSEDGFRKEIPIFLISSIENLKKYYDVDTSSHDLFDYTFNRANVAHEGAFFEHIITSITSAYSLIGADKTNFTKMLNIREGIGLENRIFTSRFLSGNGTSVSEISQYIFNEILNKPGLLIDERILAARLGIDIDKSKDWEGLKSKFADFMYSGVFSESLQRWWASDLLNWWSENFPNKSLIQLAAVDRVNLIKEKFEFDEIIEATPINKTTSTKFWTVCQAYLRPLDPKDGFLLDGDHLHVWQDKRYLSLEAILERDAKSKGLIIHPVEKERFEDIKLEFV